MSDTLSLSAHLTRWQGDRGTYHLLTITGPPADTLALHARLRRLEYGRQRGFGSVKVTARIGDTVWSTSVFPQNKPSRSSSDAIARRERQWVLLISRKVMQAEGLAHGDQVELLLSPL